MIDQRVKKLARILVHYSVKAKPGETVLIRSSDLARPLVVEVYRELIAAGAHPRVDLVFEQLKEIFMTEAGPDQLKHFPKINMYEAKNIQAMIVILAPENLKNLSRIEPQRMIERAKVLKPIMEQMTEKVRWVLCNFPTQALAQEAEMSLEDYENFLFSSTNLDWEKTKKKMEIVARTFKRGNQVRILGPDTDISFQVKGRKFIVCAGEFNMPDGEVFTGPLEDSASGHISYEFPAIYQGREVTGAKLWFEKGKVVKATADKNQGFLRSMINTDPGASRIGEFGIGMNYRIKKHTKDILFDEKIGGTIHLALGRSYPETGGKNRSAIHWDMIKDLRKRGQIYLDGKQVQKNGKFSL